MLQAALELSWSVQRPPPRTTHLCALQAACDFSLTRCLKEAVPVRPTVEQLEWGCGRDLGRGGEGNPCNFGGRTLGSNPEPLPGRRPEAVEVEQIPLQVLS